MHFGDLCSVDHYRSVRVAVCCALVRDGPEEFSIGQGWGTMGYNVAVLGAWDRNHCIAHGPFAQGAPLKGTPEHKSLFEGSMAREVQWSRVPQTGCPAAWQLCLLPSPWVGAEVQAEIIVYSMQASPRASPRGR